MVSGDRQVPLCGCSPPHLCQARALTHPAPPPPQEEPAMQPCTGHRQYREWSFQEGATLRTERVATAVQIWNPY